MSDLAGFHTDDLPDLIIKGEMDGHLNVIEEAVRQRQQHRLKRQPIEDLLALSEEIGKAAHLPLEKRAEKAAHWSYTITQYANNDSTVVRHLARGVKIELMVVCLNVDPDKAEQMVG